MANVIDSLAEQLARKNPIPLEAFKLALPLLCQSGCDRIPLRPCNLQSPFFLAGFDDTHVFLTDADTCMVCQVPYADLELPTLTDMEQIQELVFAWIDSAEGAASNSLAGHAKAADRAGVKIPVTVRWAEGGHNRDGVLILGSDALGGARTQWIAAVETKAGQNVVFRYGLSRIATAMHDGKKLTMRLKPCTTYSALGPSAKPQNRN